jgi:hypothetical protein
LITLLSINLFRDPLPVDVLRVAVIGRASRAA